jgi:hypothetical protein
MCVCVDACMCVCVFVRVVHIVSVYMCACVSHASKHNIREHQVGPFKFVSALAGLNAAELLPAPFWTAFIRQHIARIIAWVGSARTIYTQYGVHEIVQIFCVDYNSALANISILWSYEID